jgi:hypothetical protein
MDVQAFVGKSRDLRMYGSRRRRRQPGHCAAPTPPPSSRCTPTACTALHPPADGLDLDFAADVRTSLPFACRWGCARTSPSSSAARASSAPALTCGASVAPSGHNIAAEGSRAGVWERSVGGAATLAYHISGVGCLSELGSPTSAAVRGCPSHGRDPIICRVGVRYPRRRRVTHYLLLDFILTHL